MTFITQYMCGAHGIAWERLGSLLPSAHPRDQMETIKLGNEHLSLSLSSVIN